LENYKDLRGTLYKNGKKTTALKHYLKLLSEFGLIQNLNEVYFCTKLGSVFKYFLKDADLNKEAEKVFYLFIILLNDADGVLSLLSYLNNQNTPLSQIHIQENYETILNEHFNTKLEYANDIVRQKILEKERVVNYIWKNIQSYSEHLITCRLAWLNQLELVNITPLRKTTYEISMMGKSLINCLKEFTGSVADINMLFLKTRFFKMINKVYNIDVSSLQNSNEILLSSLETISNKIFPSNKFKFPYFETVIFISINSYLNYKNKLEIKEVEDILAKGIFDKKYRYTLKLQPRMNESYILKTFA